MSLSDSIYSASFAYAPEKCKKQHNESWECVAWTTHLSFMLADCLTAIKGNAKLARTGSSKCSLSNSHCVKLWDLKHISHSLSLLLLFTANLDFWKFTKSSASCLCFATLFYMLLSCTKMNMFKKKQCTRLILKSKHLYRQTQHAFTTHNKW